MTYDKAYFIAKFEAIPDEQWCVGVSYDKQERRCASGHCSVLGGEFNALNRLFPTVGFRKILPAVINDGEDPRYQQPTPKARILAALRDLPGVNLRRAFTLVEVMIVAVIIMLLLAMAIPTCNKVRESSNPEFLRAEYKLWCKIERRDDLSFDEWKTAKRLNLLNTPKHDPRN